MLAFDFRGHGQSGGHTVTYGHREKWDVLTGIDLLRERYPDIDFELFERIVMTNTVGTTRVIVAFREHVAASEQKKVVILGSAAGSISQVSAAPNSYLPYRASKAGYARDLEVSPELFQNISARLQKPLSIYRLAQALREALA